MTRRKPSYDRRWTDLMRLYISDNCATMCDEELAKELSKRSGKKITIDSVRKKRQRMGLKKKHGRDVCELVTPRKHYSTDSK